MMLSNADGTWPGQRSFRSSLYLRRRTEGLGPKIASGESNRMSMPAEICDFLDHTAAAPAEHASHSSMLQALLSSLPEPPLSEPRNSIIDTLSALADELPQPPLSPTPSLGRSLSPEPSRKAEHVSAFEVQLGQLLETPAPSRRNTDEVPLSQQQELQRLSAGSPQLLDEMPPESPLFTGVDGRSIRRTRDAIGLARSRSLSAARATWCAPVQEPLYASLPTANPTPARASLAAVLDAWVAKEKPEKPEWLSKNRSVDRAEPRAAAAPTAGRWFQVRVHSLFARGAASVSVDELSDAASTTSSTTLVDDSDSDVQAALARHPRTLRALARSNRTDSRKPSQQSSRIRAPTRLDFPGKPCVRLPTLSFVAGSRAGANPGSDAAVRSLDLEAMCAAYLPQVHAKYLRSCDMARARTASESSTLAETLAGSPVSESHDGSETSEDTLPATPRMRAPQSLLEQRRNHSVGARRISDKPDSSQLRLPAARRKPGQPQAAATVASRRRSEVEALITQANAVLNNSNKPAASHLRPPRASLPLSAELLPRRTNSIVLSPRASVLSDSGLSRIPAPTTPIARTRLGSARVTSNYGEISPLALTPVHTSIAPELRRLPSTNAAGASTSRLPRRSRPSISLSGLRPPAMPLAQQQRQIRRPPPPRMSASVTAPPGAAGLAGAARRTHMLQRQASSAVLRASYYSHSSCDSDDTAGQRRRQPLPSHDEFLTLRPVHTPDIVPRTIDPRLVERAMTPMLKLNASLAAASSLSQIVHSISDDSSNSSLASLRSPVAPPPEEPEPVSQPADQKSKMSPLSSPRISATLRASVDSGIRRFTKPGFLSRRWTKHSNVPVPVSAIPMPPPTSE
ncbi:hypothetical protein H4S02_007803, partial [Coemansia sp. RSA 2611]